MTLALRLPFATSCVTRASCESRRVIGSEMPMASPAQSRKTKVEFFVEIGDVCILVGFECGDGAVNVSFFAESFV